MLDCLIVGKGPAGISAALYCRRAGLETLVIGKDFGALERAEEIGNYYGLEAPLSGLTLAERGVRQAEALGVRVETDEVLSIEWMGTFSVKTRTNTYEAKTILLSTGKARRAPKLPGIEQFRGNGVSFCAVCDGFLYRQKPVAVLGSGAYAAEEATVLLRFTDRVTIFSDGAFEAELPEGCTLVTEKLAAVEGGERVERVRTENAAYDADAVFVAIGTAGAAEFAATMGVFEENGNLKVDDKFQTNVPGLFAAGDCTGGFLQVAKAVADGAEASRGMIAAARGEKKA